MGFIGRANEIAILQRCIDKAVATLLVIRGRRRIGKSRLIEEFARPYQFYAFSGTPPTDKTTAQSERDEFASQLAQQGWPRIQAQDWNDLFTMLAEKTQKGRVVIALDEISWMGSQDPQFLGKLKNAWDMHFKKNPKLMLILCGSASSWIEKNILRSTGFVGRVSQTLTLEPLSLNVCEQFWGAKAKNISAMEKLKVLSVTGGVPRYLEEINSALSAEDNIRNLCFTKGALLVDEFENIFANTFLRNSEVYKKIVEALAKGAKSFSDISTMLTKQHTGRTSEYLEELELAGFIKRDYTWHLNNGRDSRLSHYRLSDNYLRFYLKYILPNKKKIERNSFDFVSLSSLPNWFGVMGLQFENLVLNNRAYLWQQLHLKREDIISENPFFQRRTSKQSGCQIDYLIQTRFNTLYVCEIKCSKNPVSDTVIAEVQQKIDRLKRPKNMSCRPVLIHVGEVDPCVIESGCFSAVIDFSEALSGRRS